MDRKRSISQIILKSAARCNLNCGYCYVYNGEDDGYLRRPKVIRDDVFAALLQRINDYCAVSGQPVSIGFHGGEPTLIGTRRFRQLVEWARSELGSNLRRVALQTNATLLTEEWAELLVDLGVAPSISLDGPKHIHDAMRVDLRGRGSYDNVLRGIRLLQNVGLQPNILCVVNPRLSGRETYRHFRDLGLTQISFLLPDVSHDNFAALYGDLGETPVADFLLPVFHDWMLEDNPDVKVTLFHEIILKLMGGRAQTDALGSHGLSYLVVETDGAIESMDALRVCENGLPDTGLNVLTDGFGQLERASPINYDIIHGNIPPSGTCRTCRHLAVCGGGYLPGRYSKARLFDNPSVWCKDLTVMIEEIAAHVLPASEANMVAATDMLRPEMAAGHAG